MLQCPSTLFTPVDSPYGGSLKKSLVCWLCRITLMADLMRAWLMDSVLWLVLRLTLMNLNTIVKSFKRIKAKNPNE